ncbi:MAG: hypothetical protein RLY31_1151 [Bacteroidota bacterium]|jgi:gliding motility-associated-like protein
MSVKKPSVPMKSVTRLRAILSVLAMVSALGVQAANPPTTGIESITVLPPPGNFTDTIPADMLPHTLCFNTTNLPGIPDTIYNDCPDASGTYVDFFVDTQQFCVKYQGKVCEGEEQACIIICDDTGVCDTTYLVVVTDNSACSGGGRKIVDSVLIHFSADYCIPAAVLPGTVVSVENICPASSGQFVQFSIDTAALCVNYTGFAPGLEEVCILLRDEFGNTDTTTLCVFVLLPPPLTVIDTVVVGAFDVFCLDTSQLAGQIVPDATQFCSPITFGPAFFTIDYTSLCVEYEGIFIGTDTACVVVCDNFGVCDTTFFLIAVVPDEDDPCANTLPPVAVTDSVTTFLNTPVTIPILANDNLGTCLPVSLTLLDTGTGGIGPQHGVAALNMNQTVGYLPASNSCGLTDSLQYVLCNASLCDTGLVLVYISCAPDNDSLIIYNGFSPNGDGFNDVFTIENIDRFPNSHLQVFNRWGNLVFEAQGYDNTWDGKHRGSDLPDGTYFYLLDLGDDQEPYTGYLQLQR